MTGRRTNPRVHTKTELATGKYVRALYNFTASRENEMDLRRGAIYRVTVEQGQWCVGEDETGTCHGEFPCTYVE